MTMKNTSDYIEEHIKAILEQVSVAELRRSELASRFEVVPSQINYVLKTRFTASRGYIVESKRGGGGYIRIGRITFSDKHELIRDLLHNMGTELSSAVFADILQLLFDEQLMTEREGNLLLSAGSDEVLGSDASAIRVRMMRQVLRRLDRKED
ncbi:CtsR family transcriptional regulator [Streptococcus azizii]|uniref:Transcriptional regulator CtsR n=1 Tax=Streptococcus azizii TaxID=1579424 RepID=A0AB36JNG8_9STRE|nr:MULTISPECIES: CtsR family transcriptional regulator [Streptococcus]MBF0775667.1 CtsR family transcriptional regulator [Streptococcus sp. 19428wD3_AN2]ONK28580.1 CtsR family transcriptional regulator [Streptococcus azizii]ONK29275.1 CtsR family transcriptional regulator [Streptococcus azizii]ONK30265.1 CtsR family transcriptional regulator [Streptococcus azizii]TFU84214.1 CtsR family transcriptional regulator [Streptococcus sp. AN2]